MLRIFLLIILLLTGCTNSDRSTTDPNNQEQTKQTSSEQDNEVDSNVAAVEEGSRDIQLHRSGGGGSLIPWGITLLGIIGFSIVIYFERKKYREKISELRWEVDKYSNQYHENNQALKKLINRYQSLEKDLKKEKKEKKELKEVVSKYQNKSISKDFYNTNQDVPEIEAVGKLSENEEEEVDTKEEELFFEVPSEYGKFKHGSGISSLEERRLYKLTYRRGESEGTIEFISGKYDGIAINHKDSMIKQACSIIKENENNPSKVNQISPGKVKRLGEEWIIENKIKVEIL